MSGRLKARLAFIPRRQPEPQLNDPNSVLADPVCIPTDSALHSALPRFDKPALHAHGLSASCPTCYPFLKSVTPSSPRWGMRPRRIASHRGADAGAAGGAGARRMYRWHFILYLAEGIFIRLASPRLSVSTVLVGGFGHQLRFFLYFFPRFGFRCFTLSGRGASVLVISGTNWR